MDLNEVNDDLPEVIKCLEKHIWLVIRDYKEANLGQKSYELKVFDIIKLG